MSDRSAELPCCDARPGQALTCRCLSPALAGIALPQRLAASGRFSPQTVPANSLPEVDSGNHGNAPEAGRSHPAAERRRPRSFPPPTRHSREVLSLPPREGMVRPRGGGRGREERSIRAPGLLTASPAPLHEYANEGRGGVGRTRKRRG